MGVASNCPLPDAAKPNVRTKRNGASAMTHSAGEQAREIKISCRKTVSTAPLRPTQFRRDRVTGAMAGVAFLATTWRLFSWQKPTPAEAAT